MNAIQMVLIKLIRLQDRLIRLIVNPLQNVHLEYELDIFCIVSLPCGLIFSSIHKK